MRRIAVAVAVMFFAVAMIAAAEDFSADYVQGTVDVQLNSGWTDVMIGDMVPSNGTLKLSAGGYVELSNGSITLKLSQPGVYKISSLVQGAQANSTAGLGNILAQRVSSLSSSGSNNRATVVGGVRAAEQPSGPQAVWAGGSSAADSLKQGLAMLAKGSYNDAYYSFKDAYDNADTALAPQARFYMGYTASLKNDTFDAIKDLTTYKPDPKTAYYGDQVLTLAQLYVQTYAYQDALNLLQSFVTNASGVDLQTAYLLQGLAYQGLGDAANAKSILIKARDLVPGSDIAGSASRILATM